MWIALPLLFWAEIDQGSVWCEAYLLNEFIPASLLPALVHSRRHTAVNPDPGGLRLG
jgi:hypothetical protein